MKHIEVYTLFLLFVFNSSCGGPNQAGSPKDTSESETKEISRFPRSYDPDLYTKYEYTDPHGKRLVMQNGYPKGGARYTAPNGEVFGYAVFWTRITNETDKPLQLSVEFSENPYEVPSIPGKYFTILIPPDTLTMDKIPLYSYGLTGLESFLDSSIHKASSLKRTINPNESSGFFVVKLSLVSEGPRGGGDVLRMGLILKGEDLFYRASTYSSTPERRPPSIIGEKEIPCGSINLKNLKLLEATKSGL